MFNTIKLLQIGLKSKLRLWRLLICDRTTGKAVTSQFWNILSVIIIFSTLMGCVPQKSTSSLNLGEKYEQDDEVIIYPAYIPSDDGLPLTPAEARAFNSRGEIDAGIKQEDIMDVENNFKFFVHQHRRTMQAYIDRSARFMPYIKKIFKEKGIPEEIAYLCMVESGGNPNAISPVGASGLWQFMPYTGKRYGLVSSSWYDERRDPYKATSSAADYLLKLYSDFKDWHLAVAAYNAGEGKIGRALSGTGATNFFDLCRLDGELDAKTRLKDETRQYVPRLIAITKIMRNLKELGFVAPTEDAAWELEVLQVPPGTNLSGLARSMGLTWDEFAGMNPAYRRTASHPTIATTAYVLPDKKTLAEAWMNTPEARVFAGWREHTIKRRDTLSSIGKRYGVSIASLRQANNFNKLPRIGSVILIPGKGEKVEPVFAAQSKAITAATGVGKYTVKEGDTLFDLAIRWGTTVDSIRDVNRMGSNESKLSLGQRLSIPANSKNLPKSATVVSSAKGTLKNLPQKTYYVRPGDTLFSIARNHDVTVNALCAVNNLDPKRTALQAGQSLRIPAKGTQVAPPKTNTKPASKQTTPAQQKTVTVKSGDTLYGLALANNSTVELIRKVNNLGSSNNLRVGSTLIIPQK